MDLYRRSDSDSTTSPVLRASQPSRGSNEIKAKEKAKIHFPFSICHFSFVIGKASTSGGNDK